MENNLIEIKSYNGIQAVSARELHEKLRLFSNFTTWFNRMINYGFVEKQDYLLVFQKRKTNNPKNPETDYKDYFISLDMAKEICMLQHSEIRKQFRRYFIECEKKLTQATNNNLMLVRKIAGSESNALEYVAKWNVLRRHRCLTVEQVDAICRLLPLYPAINYIEIAKAVGTSIDTLRSVRKQINIMKEA